MLWSSQLSLSNLVVLCRALRHNLGAGLSVLDVFRQQAERGPLAVRPVAKRILAALKAGDTLGAALAKEKAHFPALFLALVGVGEETGHLPELFEELEKYFDLQQRLKRQFISQSILPVIQFIFAIFIVAGMIFVLGKIAEARPGQKPIAVFGLTGTPGALTFLGSIFGTILLAIVAYLFVKKNLRSVAPVDLFLLHVPVVGPCLEAAALGRLAIALQLTLDSGMSVKQALRLSLVATGNAAFAAYADPVVAAVKKGQTLTDALTLVRLLPRDFVDMVAIAEEGGSVPEMMRHQAAHYQEETSRRLTTLTKFASMGLWLAYAGVMIFAIFSIAQIYLGALGG